MAHPLVVHCKQARHDVYIGRPGWFARPAVVRKARRATRWLIPRG